MSQHSENVMILVVGSTPGAIATNKLKKLVASTEVDDCEDLVSKYLWRVQEIGRFNRGR